MMTREETRRRYADMLKEKRQQLAQELRDARNLSQYWSGYHRSERSELRERLKREIPECEKIAQATEAELEAMFGKQD